MYKTQVSVFYNFLRAALAVVYLTCYRQKLIQLIIIGERGKKSKNCLPLVITKAMVLNAAFT
jgi:hypothetical protein